MSYVISLLQLQSNFHFIFGYESDSGALLLLISRILYSSEKVVIYIFFSP